MKVVFITKPYVIDPLGIAYLSAKLREDGHEVWLLRTTSVEGRDIKQWLYLIKPDVLAYSVLTGSHRFYSELNRNIRQLYCRSTVVSVFGGSHPTFFPEAHHDSYVDLVFQGECDTVFSNFVSNPSKYLQQSSKVVRGEPIEQLDSLPFPDRHLIYQFPDNRDNPIKNIMTSRGCPFKCPYCYNSVYHELFPSNKVRYRSIELVVEEGARLKAEFPSTKYVFFGDDEFALREDRLQEFARLWPRRVGLPYHVQLRVDCIDEAKIRLLKQSGCTSVTFAIESGDEELRRVVLKRSMSDEAIIKGAALLRKHGLKFRTENMLGFPAETLKSALKTVALNAACKPTIGWASLFQPYPKTPLGERAREMGLFKGTVDDIPETFFERSVLDIDAELKTKLTNLQRLFGLACSVAIVRWLLPILVCVPENRLYDFIYTWWKSKRYNVLYDQQGDKKDDTGVGSRKTANTGSAVAA